MKVAYLLICHTVKCFIAFNSNRNPEVILSVMLDNHFYSNNNLVITIASTVCISL